MIDLGAGGIERDHGRAGRGGRRREWRLTSRSGKALLRLARRRRCSRGVIGLERELREQEAGLRTHMLVCVGAAMFMLVGVYGWSD